MKKHHDSKFILVGIGVILLITGGFFNYKHNQNKDVADESMIIEEVNAANSRPDGYIHRYSDGVYIPEEDQITRLYSVMIENSAEAWPLSGLSEARLVFEAPVEGAIPRFLVIFDDKQEIEEIGPVRSARPYYVEWAYGLQALYAHVGGSPQGLSLIKKLPIRDLNQFFFSGFFWRSSQRFAPHNVYTSIDELAKGFDYREYEDPDMGTLFNYQEEYTPIEGLGQLKSITIPFSPVSGRYDAHWVYNKDQNNFQRYQGSSSQSDKDGADVYASNIVVLLTDISIIDEVGRRDIRTIGDGEGYLFNDGNEYEIRWEKTSQKSELQLFIEDEEALFVPGSTWIEVVSNQTVVEVELNE